MKPEYTDAAKTLKDEQVCYKLQKVATLIASLKDFRNNRNYRDRTVVI